MAWRVADFEFAAGDVCQVVLSDGANDVVAAFYMELWGRVARLHRLDIQGPGANQLGLAQLHDLARSVMEVLYVDELRIEGATRTSGARPGRRPAALVFRRPGMPDT
jgi:hypothetical protein